MLDTNSLSDNCVLQSRAILCQIFSNVGINWHLCCCRFFFVPRQWDPSTLESVPLTSLVWPRNSPPFGTFLEFLVLISSTRVKRTKPTADIPQKFSIFARRISPEICQNNWDVVFKMLPCLFFFLKTKKVTWNLFCRLPILCILILFFQTSTSVIFPLLCYLSFSLHTS